MPSTQKTRLFYVGGASASGKTTASEKLGRMYGINVISLDKYHNILLKSNIVDLNEVREITENICEKIICDLIDSKAMSIIEGGWIRPAVASRLAEKGLVAVYCGYPAADLDDRISIISGKGEHWSTKDEDGGKNWICKQIAESADYKKQSVLYGFEFIDFSDFSAGHAQLENSFSMWFESNQS